MGSFHFSTKVNFVPDSRFKYIKLPHFCLPNPFDFADFLHNNNKCSFDNAIRTIRDCIDWFTENTRDKLGTRKSVDTTQSGHLNRNASLRSPSIQVHPSQNNYDIFPALKEIYDGQWSSLS